MKNIICSACAMIMVSAALLDTCSGMMFPENFQSTVKPNAHLATLSVTLQNTQNTSGTCPGMMFPGNFQSTAKPNACLPTPPVNFPNTQNTSCTCSGMMFPGNFQSTAKPNACLPMPPVNFPNTQNTSCTCSGMMFPGNFQSTAKPNACLPMPPVNFSHTQNTFGTCYGRMFSGNFQSTAKPNACLPMPPVNFSHTQNTFGTCYGRMFSGNPKINAVPIAHLATPDVYPVTSDDRSVTPDDFFARLDDFLEESNTQDTLDVCRLTKNILHLVKDKVAKDSSCSTQNSANNVAAQICGCECNCENVSRHKCNCFTFKTVWGHGFCFAKESLGAWLDAWNAKILVLGGIKKSLLHKYISIADIPTLNALLPAASKYKDLILETVFDTTVFTKEVLRESVVNAATTGKYNYISELSERLKRTSDAAFHSSAINDAFVSVAAICESSDLLHSLEALIKTGGVMNNSIYRAIRERSVTGKPFFDFLSRIAYKTGHSGYLVPANVLENLY